MSCTRQLPVKTITILSFDQPNSWWRMHRPNCMFLRGSMICRWFHLLQLKTQPKFVAAKIYIADLVLRHNAHCVGA